MFIPFMIELLLSLFLRCQRLHRGLVMDLTAGVGDSDAEFEVEVLPHNRTRLLLQGPRLVGRFKTPKDP